VGQAAIQAQVQEMLAVLLMVWEWLTISLSAQPRSNNFGVCVYPTTGKPTATLCLELDVGKQMSALGYLVRLRRGCWRVLSKRWNQML
jgi:hypothetical protein